MEVLNRLDKVIVSVCFGGVAIFALAAGPLGYSKLTVLLVAGVFGSFLGWYWARRMCG